MHRVCNTLTSNKFLLFNKNLGGIKLVYTKSNRNSEEKIVLQLEQICHLSMLTKISADL